MPVKIWDIWIRLFHWSLACLIVLLLLSGKTGWMFFEVHRQAGEAVIALLFFRLCWGVVGSSNARLYTLVRHPHLVVKHLSGLARGKVEPARGHNPAGGWAVLIMLLLVTAQAVSGIFIADEDELLEGAFYGALSYDTSSLLMDMHLFNANLILAIVLLHVIMVFAYLLRASQDLIRPMISGKMEWPAKSEPPSLFIQRWWVGMILFVFCLVLTGGVLSWN